MFQKDLNQLANHELEKKIKKLNIKYFREDFMKKTLPNKINNN